mgnify:CR=1 FL=1
MEYALSNDSISIKVSTAGGSFTSIEAGGREYLWQGDPAVWSGQAPICFPICGGLRDNSAMTPWVCAQTGVEAAEPERERAGDVPGFGG